MNANQNYEKYNDSTTETLQVKVDTKQQYKSRDKPSMGIAIGRVHNKELLSSLGEIYKCNICFNIMINPTDCEKCGHSYCLECITKNNCPFNCSGYNIKPSSAGIKLLLTQIMFKCFNEGCGEILSYNNILLHDQECEHKMTKCPTPNCGITLKKKDLENHIKIDCKHVTMLCQYCNNDFARFEFKEHLEDCRNIFNSLNSDKNILTSKPKLNNKYIEALSTNIVKIIRDNEEKYKQLEEQNRKIKEDLNSNIQNIFHKVSENDANETKNSFVQILRNEFDNNETILTKIKEALAHNNESYSESILNIQNQLNLMKNNLSNLIENSLYLKISNELKQTSDKNENSINTNLNELRNFVVENISLETKNQLQDLNIKLNKLEEEKNKIVIKTEEIFNSITNSTQTSKINHSDLFNKTHKLNELFDDLKRNMENLIIKNKEGHEIILEQLENIQENINGNNKTSRDIKSIISEEFSEISNNLNQIQITQRDCHCHLTKQLNEIDIKMENKLKILQNNIENTFEKKLKDMYNLKWCNECSKVDYFFGFITCDICTKENCKQCVSLCKFCKTLFCKNCVECPNCKQLSCLNCRIECYFCSKEKASRYCTTCVTNCVYCQKNICSDCSKRCIECKGTTCGGCAKFCRNCKQSSCRRCDTSKNFKTCFYCQQFSCFECIFVCQICEFEVCKGCYVSCRQCKKSICTKCRGECSLCKESFCLSCSKEINQHKCSLCKKTFCITCTKNFRKCKSCGEASCKDCYTNCKKCKNFFCSNCNLNCDNCNEFQCVSCVYKCVCDKLIFCEKCLFDVKPIGPHNCVMWLNGTSKFTGIKTRSLEKLPKNFEAKLYLEKSESENLIVGITDNNYFTEDSISFVDNIWALKTKTGQKYSSKNSLERYYDKETREKDFIIIAVKNDNLYFRINFDDNPPAFSIPPNRNYYLYIENDTSSDFSNVVAHFVYIRKI